VFRVHGQTVIASALVPLNGSRTLIYGSCDAVSTFVDLHPHALQPVLEEIGRKFSKHHVSISISS
jgi:hypothetical protein